MSLNLLGPIAAYFEADQRDGDSVAQCFTDEGVVADEGQTISGRAAISQWRSDAAVKYNYTCEPLTSEEIDGKIVVTARLEGDFPGSPVVLRYAFVLDGEKVASLGITG